MRPLDRIDLFAGFEGKKVYFGCFFPPYCHLFISLICLIKHKHYFEPRVFSFYFVPFS